MYEDFYNAQFKEDVTEAIEEKGLGNSDENWVPLDRSEDNASNVGGQTDRKVIAISELVTNSIDAITLKNFQESSVSKGELERVQEAVDSIVDVDEEDISLEADGDKDNVNFIVKDTGHGQPKESFEETFLSIGKPGRIKQEYNFLQGQYGMGSHGSLNPAAPHGDYGCYKFIASSHFKNKNEWTWSIIRLNHDKQYYEYLKPNGELPTFSGTLDGKDYGTVVKVFDYQLSVGKGRITRPDSRFRRRFERIMFDLAIPVELRDKRTNHSATAYGHKYWLEEHDKFKNVVKTKIPRRNFEPGEKLLQNQSRDIGQLDIDIYLLKQKDEIRELEEDSSFEHDVSDRMVDKTRFRDEIYPVIYTINGQAHARENPSYIKGSCNLQNIGKDLIVNIDFTESPITDNIVDMNQLFDNSRDKMKGDAYKEISNDISDLISDIDILREEERDRIGGSSTEEEDTNSVLQDLVSRSDEIRDYLDSGEDIEVSGDTYSRPLFDLPERPDTLEMITSENRKDEEKPDTRASEPYMVRFSENSDNQKLKFWLNGATSFSAELSDNRNNDVILKLSPRDRYMSFNHDGNTGILDLQVDVSDLDDEEEMEVEVVDSGNSLSERFILEPTERNNSGEGGEGGEGGGGDSNYSPPEHREVYEKDWNEKFDENKTIHYNITGETISEHIIEINLDSNSFLSFLSRHNISETEKVKQKFISVIKGYSVAIYHKYSDEFEDGKVAQYVSKSVNSIAPILLDTLYDEEEIEIELK